MNDSDFQQQLAIFDSLLDELSRSATDPATFSPNFFASVISVIESIISPEGIAVIAAGPERSWLLIAGTSNAKQQASGWVQLVPANPTDPTNSLLQPSCDTVSIASIAVAGTSWGWLVIQSAAPLPPVHWQLQAAIAEVIGEHLATQAHHKSNLAQTRAQQFSHHVHATLDPQTVVQHIANDGRLLLNCERVSVYIKRRGRFQLAAVSGVAKLEPRSELLQQQSKLVREAAKLATPIGSDKPPSQSRVATTLQSYQQKSSFNFLFGLPLVASSRTGGYLLAESNDNIDRVEFARGLSVMVPAASQALGNSLVYDSVPFRAVLGWFPTSLVQLIKTGLAMGLLTLGVLALCFWKTDFKVRILGELRPVEQRFVFAPHDGIVERVLVRHGQQVKTGQTLLEIRSPELELALAKNSGETEKLRKLLDAKKIALNQASSDPDAPPAIVGQLSSDVSDLEYQLSSIADELKFLQQQQAEMVLTAPLSGTVITWNVDEVLAKKPVRWGDSLVQIVNESGEWELRFLVPERRLGYLLSSRQQGSGERLEFFFESNPAVKFESTVAKIGNSTERDAEIGSVALLIAAATEGDYIRRHGAKVIADVDCGKRSMGYVWLHEWIDSIRRRFVW